VVRRYNREGPEALHNRRFTHSHRATPPLSAEQRAEQRAELAKAVRGPAPEGEQWLGRTVAAWMSERRGRPVSVSLGWAYLVRLEGKRRKPRPRHGQADPVAQEACKKSSAHSSAKSRPRSPTASSSSGRSTNTASG
jgi:hypothetical protein